MKGRLTRAERALVNDIRKRLRKEAEEGTTCPCCQGNVKVYYRHFHAEMGMFLIKLVRAWQADQRFYEPRELIKTQAKASTDASYLVMWGLVEKDGKAYRPTDQGIWFVEEHHTVPRAVHVLSPPKMVVGWDDYMVGIRDVLGEKFDYDKLMGR